MKQIALLFILATALFACNNTPDQPAATLPPAPTAPTEGGALPTDLPGGAQSPEPTATDAALATAAASPTAEPPTDIPTAIPLPTEEPSPTAEPPTEAPATDTPSPEPTAPGVFAPGQQEGASLTEGGSVAYLVNGRRFQPLILFVEPTNELNVALTAYVGDQTGQTTPEGVTPPAAADNALAGRPEILVLSPEADGLYTLVVRAIGGQGSLAAHLYDLTTPAPGVAVQQPDALAAGAEMTYEVTSRGARPVIAVADPTDQSDVALDVLGSDGTLLTTANFSGPGGVETAYVLPLGTTTYTVKVREASGGAAAFQVLVVTLE
jgi:hypothetical protein